MSDIVKIIGESILNVVGKDKDGIQCKGPYEVFPSKTEKDKWDYKDDPNGNTDYLISHCYIDNSNVKPDMADEAISVVWGANATIKNCYIKNWGKAILLGSGDEPRAMTEKMTVTIENCVFDGNSRRHPYVQGGITVNMKNCVIKNWGKYFHRKSGGIRVENATLHIEDCVFIQDRFMQSSLLNFFKDCFFQVETFKDLPNVFRPGPTRGLYTVGNSNVNMSNCYTNKWWISLGGYNKNPMSQELADAKMLEIMSNVPMSSQEAREYKTAYNQGYLQV